ncbi:MAG TPA: hypothetical protein VMS29_01720, partial [Pyrinomonadaceae bacterium]|nr:hypothetical protein [Pyrinomonadaceae bacterium]
EVMLQRPASPTTVRPGSGHFCTFLGAVDYVTRSNAGLDQHGLRLRDVLNPAARTHGKIGEPEHEHRDPDNKCQENERN